MTRKRAAPVDARRKRILYRASHRGTKEADVLIGGFVAAQIQTLTAEQLDRLECLLDELDLDIVNWVTGQKPVPAQYDHDIFHMLVSFKPYETEEK
ncbi:MAG: succinate dehydrogenase assembly factor 2 [Bacteroidetes bacterium]|nr:succinate dehydrogenase assembly factor 2 [Bacteroidota bacterium]